MTVKELEAVTIEQTGGLNLNQTLDCGQCFRWKRTEFGGWQGVVGGKILTLSNTDGILHAQGGATVGEIRHYLDLDTDYGEMQARFAPYETLRLATQYAGGIRILRQDSWEALATFILSQNNNIPRITGLVQRLCESFGEPLQQGEFSFPTAEKLAVLTEQDLAPVRSGFRARYILDAAQKVASGQVDLARAQTLPLQEAEAMLMQIVGVGIKVADCALLFGCHRLDAFPVDVWIKRAMSLYFPHGFPEELTAVSGAAQQLLFHYIRTSPDTEEQRKAERELKKATKAKQ